MEQWIAAWRAANVDPPLRDAFSLAAWLDERSSAGCNDAGAESFDAASTDSGTGGGSEDALTPSNAGGSSEEALAPSNEDGSSASSPGGPADPAAAEPAPLVLASAPGPAAIVRVTEPHLPSKAAAVLSSSASGAALAPPSAVGGPVTAASAPATCGSTGWVRMGVPAESPGAPDDAGPVQRSQQAQQAQPANNKDAKRRRAVRPVPVVRPQPPSLSARLAGVTAVGKLRLRPTSQPTLKAPAQPSTSAPSSAKELEAAYKQRIAAVLADSKLSSSSGAASQPLRPAAAMGPLTSAHQARSKVG